jgi:uncharacterized membrane protein
MNERERQGLIEDYLKQLGKALSDAPAASRRELLEDVRGHIAEAWARDPQQDRAALLNILERLGPPDALAREQRERLNIPAQAERTDLLAPIAIVLTAIFWPIGIVLAWISTRWRLRDKAIATALPILGLALLLALSLPALLFFQSGPVVTRQVVTPVEGGPATAMLPVTPSGHSNVVLSLTGAGLSLCGLFGAPLAAAIYLAWRLRRPSDGTGVIAPVGITALLLLGLLGLLLPSAI